MSSLTKAILTFLLTVIIGWWVTGIAFKAAPSPEQNQDDAPASLLGPRGQGHEMDALSPIDRNGPNWLEEELEVLQQIAGASIEQLEAWMQASSGDRQKLGWLATKMAELDPERAFAFVERYDSYHRLQGIVMSVWMKADLHTALSEGIKLDPAGWSLGNAMDHIDSDSVREAFTFLKEHGWDQSNPDLLANMIDAFYGSDPKEAASLGLELAMRGYEQGLGNVLDLWTRASPDKALHWVQSLESPIERERALEILAFEWPSSAQAQGLETLWPLLTTDAQKGRFITKLGLAIEDPADLQRVLTWSDDHLTNESQRQKVLERMVSSSATRQQPELLAKVLPEMTASMRSSQDVLRATERWAETDTAGFSTWLEGQDSDWIQEVGQLALFNHHAKENPLEALHHLPEASPKGNLGRNHANTLGHLFTSIEAEGGDISSLAKTLPDSTSEMAWTAYAESAARQRPAEVMTMLQQQNDPEAVNDALHYTAGYWAAEDPEAAADWVAQLDESEGRGYAMGNVVDNWARLDREAAIRWLSDQPDSPNRDQAADRLLTSLVDYDPETALSLLQSLGTVSDTHRDSLQQSLQTIAQRDLEKAQRLMEAIPMDAAVREQVRTSLDEAAALQAFLMKRP